MKDKLYKQFLNFLSPEFCLIKEFPIFFNENIEFISQDFLDSIEYAGNPKEIFLRFAENSPRDDIHINKANALFKITPENNYLEILHRIKYHGMTVLAYEMGKLLGNKLIKDEMTGYDYICPVPVHKIRLKERGYNQARFIAEGVAASLNSPIIDDLLLRINYNISQTQLSAAERTQNVAKSFAVNDNYSVSLKKVLIVDDILTTGSTINNCALELLKSGAIFVDSATLALA